MFGFGNGSYYDYLRSVHGEEEAFARYEKQQGKLMVATIKEDSATRMFVRSINPLTDLRKKSGWWNTFTITKRPYEAGTFICKIDEVRTDKNGYPIFVAHPVVRVAEEVLVSDEIAYLFGLSGMFTEEFGGWNTEYNHGYFEEQLGKYGPIPQFDGVNSHIAAVMESVRLFINGTINREQIVEWLHEPTDSQKQEAAFEEDVLRFFQGLNNPEQQAKFPLTVEKAAKLVGDSYFVWPEKKVTFVRDLLMKYEVAVGGKYIKAVPESMWHQIETYLVFDKARKQANKAAKTAAKKAKKAAAQSAN